MSDIGWYLIKTAPRDGSFVLLLEEGERRGLTVPYVCMGSWRKHPAYIDGGYWSTPVGLGTVVEPSHWMPLPTTPSDSGEGQGMSVAVFPGSGLYEILFPLRPDCTVRLILPLDLTAADVQRLSVFLLSLAEPAAPPAGSGAGE